MESFGDWVSKGIQAVKRSVVFGGRLPRFPATVGALRSPRTLKARFLRRKVFLGAAGSICGYYRREDFQMIDGGKKQFNID